MPKPNNKTVVTQKGLGCGSILCIALTLIFVTAKIFHQIEWSWVWVLSPIWIYASLITLLIIGCLVFGVVVVLLQALLK